MKTTEKIIEIYKALKETPTVETGRRATENLPGLILELARSRETDCSIDDLRDVIELCKNRSCIPNQAWWNELISEVAEMAGKKRLDKTALYWLETIMSIYTTESERKKIVDSLWISQIYSKVLPMMESMAYECPTESLMNWFVTVLDRNLYEHKTERIYNILAFFHLIHRSNVIYRDKAINYLKTLERHGMTIENPYTDTSGVDYGKVADAILKNQYSREMELSIALDYLWEVCTRIAMDHVRCNTHHGSTAKREEKPLSYQDAIRAFSRDDRYITARNNMDVAYSALLDVEKESLEEWDRFLNYYTFCIEQCMSDNTDVGRAQATMLLMLLYHTDNWLLKCIEGLSNNNEEKYYELIKEWIGKIKSLDEVSLAFIQNGLYSVIIQKLWNDGRFEAAQALLSEQVGTVDFTSFVGIIEIEDWKELYGKVFFSNNAMALLKRYHDTGDMDSRDELIAKIHNASELFEKHLPTGRGNQRATILLTKYIELLKTIGCLDEAQFWLKWCEDNQDKTYVKYDECLANYLHADYEAALEVCRERYDSDEFRDEQYILQKRMRLIEYMIQSKENAGSEEDREELPGKISWDRGITYIDDIGILHFERTLEEVLTYIQDIDILADDIMCFVESGETIPSDIDGYLTLNLRFDPEPDWTRGDYIRSVYSDFH